MVELRPIGRVESPLTDRAHAPRQADEGAPPAVIVVADEYLAALDGIGACDVIVLLTWFDRADRSVLVTRPRGDPNRPEAGVFATRSPDRPNPIGLHTVRVAAVDGARVHVERLEALDGTPVLDIKPFLGGIAER